VNLFLEIWCVSYVMMQVASIWVFLCELGFLFRNLSKKDHQ
jgi:hypothetical protein